MAQGYESFLGLAKRGFKVCCGVLTRNPPTLMALALRALRFGGRVRMGRTPRNCWRTAGLLLMPRPVDGTCSSYGHFQKKRESSRPRLTIEIAHRCCPV